MQWKVIKGKYHGNKSLTGPLKILGGPGKYSLFPPSSSWWDWLQLVDTPMALAIVIINYY